MGRSGGQIVVDSLVAHGVTTTFGVPGESYLAVLDALHDTDIRVVTCRHEGGAAYMAEAWAKFTGRVGVCLVTRGPGATNASIGVHAAMQASTPMVLLVGQVATHEQGREAFQEIDYREMFGGVAKWATEIESADTASAVMAEAFHRAASGRPGPVVVALPEDVLSSTTDSPAVPAIAVDLQQPSADEVDAVLAALAAAERPVVLVGGGTWNDEARADLVAFAEAHDLPVVVTFRRNDLMDNTSASYVGEAGVSMPPSVRETLEAADCVIALGPRFGEMTTAAWSLWPVGDPGVTLVHVHPDPSQLGKIHTPSVGITARSDALLAALRSRAPATPGHGEWRAARRDAFVASLSSPAQPGPLDMGEVMAWLCDNLPADAVLTNGAGNFSVWPNKFFVYGPEARLLAPQAGSMGYGLPAAVAAKVADPARTVVCFAGDGDLQMNLPELGTGLQHDAQPIVLVIDNGMYGTIRMHQERHFPERVVGTDIVNPDFIAIARAYDMHAEQVETTADFPAAFARARASTTGALLHLRVDPDQLTPTQSITQARQS
ncbi:MAG: thiamine pyrophosphate-binding protein [Acidimicrobiales bacterium]|jgi:acetolactate synthase-1/2/3 large subunit|nr:thiamine pyrophosphate-binding protein [Acidimicrobiales bacterium]